MLRTCRGRLFLPVLWSAGPADAWFTEAQLALPGAWSRSRSWSRCSRSSRTTSRGALSCRDDNSERSLKPAAEPDPLTEDDDMTLVDFTCHPSEPLKVLDDWAKPVYCLICGKPNA